MPRKVAEPATHTISAKVTTVEHEALQQLLRRRADDVRRLTGRAELSGLVRLLIHEAVQPARRGVLYVSRRPPGDGHHFCFPPEIQGEFDLDRLREALTALEGTANAAEAREILRRDFGIDEDPE